MEPFQSIFSLNPIHSIDRANFKKEDQAKIISFEIEDLPTDFELDRIIIEAFESGEANRDFWLLHSTLSQPLEFLSQNAVECIRDLLKLQIIFSVNDKNGKEHFIKLTLKELLKMVPGQCQLVGGYLRKLIGMQGCLEAGSRYTECTKGAFVSQLLKDLNELNGDIDFRCWLLPKLLSIQGADLVVDRIAEKTDRKDETANFVRQLRRQESGMVKFQPLYFINGRNHEKITDAYLISFKTIHGDSIDLTLNRTDHRMQPETALTTIQDLFMDISPLLEETATPHWNVKLMPSGKVHQGNQALLDLTARVIHLLSENHIAFAKLFGMSTDLYRHPGKISAYLLKNVLNYCNREYHHLGEPTSETLFKLISCECSHHFNTKGPSEIAAIFNACKWLDEGYNLIANQLFKKITETKKDQDLPRQFLEIRKAAELLPFDILHAAISCKKFLQMMQTDGDGRTLICGDFLTRFDNKVCIMSVIERTSIFLSADLLKEIDKILECKNEEQLKAIPILLKAFESSFTFEIKRESVIHRNLTKLQIQLDQLEQKALQLLQSKHFAALGYPYLFFCYTLSPSITLFQQLLLYVPCICKQENSIKGDAAFFLKKENEKWNLFSENQFFEMSECLSRKEIFEAELWGSWLCILAKSTALTSKSVELWMALNYRDNIEICEAIYQTLFGIVKPVPLALKLFHYHVQVLPQASLFKHYQQFIDRFIVDKPKEAVKLLIEASMNEIFPSKSQETYGLWMRCFKTVFLKDKEKALEIWQQGNTFKIWKQTPSSEDISILNQFVCWLQENPSSTRSLVAKEIVDIFNLNFNKTQWPAELLEFSEQVEKKIEAEEDKFKRELETWSGIQRGYKKRKNLDQSCIESLQSLFDSLIIEGLDKKTQLEKLKLIRNILNSRARQYLEETDEQFLKILNTCILRAYQLHEPAQTNSFINTFLEMGSEKIFDSPLRDSQVKFLEILISLLKDDDFQISDLLLKNLTNRSDKFCTYFEDNGQIESGIQFLHSLYIKHCPAKICSAGIFLKVSYWLNPKGNIHPKLLDFLSKIDILPENRKEALLEACDVLCENLIASNHPELISKWIKLMAKCCCPGNKKAPFILLKWILKVSELNQFDLTPELFHAAAFFFEELKKELLNILDKGADLLIENHPEIFSKAIENEKVESLLSEHPSLDQKLHVMIRGLIKKDLLSTAMDLHKKFDLPLSRMFEELLNSAAKHSQIDLKVKAWTLYLSAEQRLKSSDGSSKDLAWGSQWYPCWKTAIKILRTICMEQPAYLKEFSDEFKLIGNVHSKFFYCVVDQLQKNLEENGFEFILKECLIAIKKPWLHVDLLKTALEFRTLLNLKSNAVNCLLLDKFFDSKNLELFNNFFLWHLGILESWPKNQKLSDAAIDLSIKAVKNIREFKCSPSMEKLIERLLVLLDKRFAKEQNVKHILNSLNKTQQNIWNKIREKTKKSQSNLLDKFSLNSIIDATLAAFVGLLTFILTVLTCYVFFNNRGTDDLIRFSTRILPTVLILTLVYFLMPKLTNVHHVRKR